MEGFIIILLVIINVITLFILAHAENNKKEAIQDYNDLVSNINNYKWSLKYNFKSMSKKEFKKYFKDLFSK